MTQVLQDVDTAVSVCFVVKIDDVNLGAFSSCDGLGCEVVLESREEGGNNVHLWQLPSRLKYSNIKLTRALGAETSKIAAWVSSMAAGYERKTAVIQAMTGRRQRGRGVVAHRRRPGSLDRSDAELGPTEGADRDPRDRPSRLHAEG